MVQLPLMTIGRLQRKSLEASGKDNDGLITTVSEGFDAVAAVLTKDSDPEVSNAPSWFPIEPKEEPIDIPEFLPLFQEISALDLMRDEKMFKEEETNYEEKEGITTNFQSINSDSLDGAQNSGMDDRFGNSLGEPPHNDHNYARIMKRKSSNGDEESESASKKLYFSRENDTELQCPECQYRTRSVNCWANHLRMKHATTPTLAGLALLCGCGKESLSENHSRTCDHGNHTTVIRKRDGPIGRLDDEKTTPQCVLCEAYPKTANSYAHHIYTHHKSTPSQNGIYLLCSCGLEVRSNSRNCMHLEECDHRQFTLHRLDDEKRDIGNHTTVLRKKFRQIQKLDYVKATPQCVLCEMFPKPACGYAFHLERHHKSSLAENGIYLLCSCGLEVRSSSGNLNHSKGCGVLFTSHFTLHKLGDE